MTPVIEYKSKNNYEFLHEVIEMIQEKDMEQEVVIISFQLDALQEFRKATDIVPLWYLVQKLNDTAIEEALSLGNPAGIDFNAKNKKLTQANIKKVIDAGLEVGCWTIDDPMLMDKMLSCGVNTITMNLIIPDPTQPQTKGNAS